MPCYICSDIFIYIYIYIYTYRYCTPALLFDYHHDDDHDDDHMIMIAIMMVNHDDYHPCMIHGLDEGSIVRMGLDASDMIGVARHGHALLQNILRASMTTVNTPP